MKNILFFSFLLLITITSTVYAQRTLIGGPTFNNGVDTLGNNGERKVTLSGKTKYTDYKIISPINDTTYIDTTLTITKEYKFNFLRKDNFELLAFHNQGQTFNNLAYNFRNRKTSPSFGYRAKEFFYMDVDDINYYQVPTPTTEILYRTGMQQGQVLDALFTLNFSERMNFSVAYKGVRSLGQYRRSLVSLGNFRTTFRYETKEEQYTIRAHIATQDMFGQENGGLTDSALESFIANDPNFSQRSRLDVNLEDTENQFDATRFYIEHDFKLLSSKKDSIKKNTDFSNLKIGHRFLSENKTYKFIESSTSSFFGNAHTSSAINENVTNRYLSNQFYLEFNSKYVLGKFRAKADLKSVTHAYDSILNPNNPVSTRQLKADNLGFGADWRAQIKGFSLYADAGITPGNNTLSGNYLYAKASFKKDSLFTVSGNINIHSTAPNFNFLLHQSAYDNYNWENNFENIQTRNLGVNLESKWINASLDFTNIDNYTYFGSDNLPYQTSESIAYLKVKAWKEFRSGKFGLYNTLMYQNVSSGSSVFRVPDFVTRNTFYYKDYWFKGNPMQVMIGATFNYFTEYNANAYNPLLSDFTLQDTDKIGYPTLDLFFNAQVRRTRIYFKIDNALSNVSSKNYFSAPRHPYRDFVIRFGVVWNWFI